MTHKRNLEVCLLDAPVSDGRAWIVVLGEMEAYRARRQSLEPRHPAFKRRRYLGSSSFDAGKRVAKLERT